MKYQIVHAISYFIRINNWSLRTTGMYGTYVIRVSTRVINMVTQWNVYETRLSYDVILAASDSRVGDESNGDAREESPGGFRWHRGYKKLNSPPYHDRLLRPNAEYSKPSGNK